MVLITIVFMGFINQFITGGHYPVVKSRSFFNAPTLQGQGPHLCHIGKACACDVELGTTPGGALHWLNLGASHQILNFTTKYDGIHILCEMWYWIQNTTISDSNITTRYYLNIHWNSHHIWYLINICHSTKYDVDVGQNGRPMWDHRCECLV